MVVLLLNLAAEKFDSLMLFLIPTLSTTSLHPLACYGFRIASLVYLVQLVLARILLSLSQIYGVGRNSKAMGWILT